MSNQRGTRNEGIAAVLEKWQRKDRLTDEQVAALLGVSRQMLHHWRRGASAPNRNRWQLIAERTGLSVESVAVAIAQSVKP